MKHWSRSRGLRMTPLRETRHYQAHAQKRGVRIIAKDRGAMPSSRVVSVAAWQILVQMNDDAFDGSCVLELGIGTRAKSRRGY